MRTVLFLGCVVAGAALALAGFLLAAPIGAPTSSLYSQPRMEFAPAIFILGVVLVFLSAVIYELVPDR